MKRIVFTILCVVFAASLFSQNRRHLVVDYANDSVIYYRDKIINRIANNDTTDISEDLNKIVALYYDYYSWGSKEFNESILWCAMMSLEWGDDQEAERLMKGSCDLFAQYGDGPFEGRDTINEILYLDLQSKLKYKGSAFIKAIKYSRRSSDLKREFFGEDSEVYLKSLLDLSKLYTERLNHKMSQRYHNLGYQSYVKMIKREFCEKSESERSVYWASVKEYIDRTILIAHKSAGMREGKNLDSLASAAYNALLLSKGLLLNTTIGFENYIIESGNTEAIYNLMYKKSLVDKDAPQQTIDSIDYVILNALKANGQSFDIPHLSIGWKNVSRKLADDDLAIEFYKTTEGEYGAILVKRNWKAPKIIPMKEFVYNGFLNDVPLDKALRNCSFENFSKDDAEQLWKLSQAVWTDKIIKYFPTTETGRVYFAADGELLVTGIEYLPFIRPRYDGEKVVAYYSISDLFNVYRLTSTRELATDKSLATDYKAAVYGGLAYNMDTEELIADNKKYSQNGEESLLYAYNSHERSLREAAEPIPELDGTRREADSIIGIISQSGQHEYDIKPYLGKDGTETSFKALSGNNQRLIHVGTHGFFYDAADTIQAQSLQLGDNPLSHCGLLFSGANNKWYGDYIPKGVDDGFLTALEISSLDLRGLDLVVLSACETGKGYITSDGVFGLQRGFKMASANAILMSLWKVDDDATCMLMTEFYRNWIGCQMTKHDALEVAKQTVRSHKEKGWDKPKYWAAFILLDGLD